MSSTAELSSGITYTRGKDGVPPLILALMCGFAALVAFSFLAPVLFPVDLGETNLTNRLKPPSVFSGGASDYLFGTDHLGRDYAIRIVYAIRSSIIIVFSGTLIASVIGTLLGAIAGLYGGWFDSAVQFIIDILISVPDIIISLTCVALFGSNEHTIIFIIGFTGWGGFARIIRGQIIQIKEADFIKCSRSMGASGMRILFEQILVNVASPIIVHGTMRLSGFILLESSLSFLGLGVQPPETSLGVLVNLGRDYLINQWWLSIIPSVIIIAIVLAVSLTGDWLRDKLDPKLHRL